MFAISNHTALYGLYTILSQLDNKTISSVSIEICTVLTLGYEVYRLVTSTIADTEIVNLGFDHSAFLL